MCRIAGPDLARTPRPPVSFSERAPASAPATSSTGPSGGSSKISRASSFGIAARAGGDRPADDAVARAVRARRAGRRGTRASRTAARAGSRARGARRPRRAPPGCASSRRRAPSARRRSRRAPKTTSGRRRRRIARHARGATPGAVERAEERRRRLPREAADRERVELVAGVRNEPRLDAIRRPGERHEHAARPSAPPRLRARAARARPSPRPRSRTEAVAAFPRCAMLRRIPTEASSTTRLEPP